MSRRDRIKKVRDLRQKTLDDRVKRLHELRAAEDEARKGAEEQRRALGTAFIHRQSLEQGSATAQAWHDADQWLAERVVHKQVADLKLQRVAVAVHRARQAVLIARNDVKRLELLDDKLAQHEQVAEKRAEALQHDEVALQRTLARMTKS